MTKEPTYIGDGVYASFDGYQIWLETKGGWDSIASRIAIDPDTWASLLEYVERLKAAPASAPSGPGVVPDGRTEEAGKDGA